ncbi:MULTISPECIES: BP74-related protein [unclassified Streptomyces]|uniref:BP74-related protein n=1 Tax=unclassified Streptomyces TaxID=2593676 RepID=UPI002E1D5B27|nr:calmodulin-binding protein [Streptomyces sp. NBC_01023]
MRRVTKIGLLASALMLTLTGAATGTAAAQPDTATTTRAAADRAAYFQVANDRDYRHTWVIKLTKAEDIEHARELVSGKTDERPHVIGRIVKKSEPYNPGWSYNLRPETIGFFDVAIEVCDAAPWYVEDHLDEAGGAFLPGLVWCPWGSHITKEVPAP